MPPPDGPVPIEGEAELDAAVRAAMTAYLDEARALVVDGKEPSLTAAVDMRQWPDDGVWRALVDRLVRPVVERIYGRAYEDVADEAPPPARTQAWIDGLTRRLTPQSWPRRVWAAVQQAVMTSRAQQEGPALTEARVRDILRIDAPGAEYRERTANLRATVADPDAPEEQRRAAAEDLRGREGPPPDGAGTPWISDAGRIAQTEAVAATGSGAVEAAQDTGAPGTTKVWIARDDDRTRPAHREADGQDVPAGDPFVVDTESLMYPGDPDGSPENTINCRCEVRIVPAARTASGAPEENEAMTTTTETPAAVTAGADVPEPNMRAALVAAGNLEEPRPVFAGAVDVWDPEAFPGFGGRPSAEAFTKPDWLKGPGTLPTPESIQAEEPFDENKPRVVLYPDNTIVGYTSTWPSCHVGFPDECVTAPRDTPTGPGQLGYGDFHRFPVQIADGALRLGKVTMVTVKGRPGHAPISLDAIRAAAHYDNAASLMAMVRAGEDEHGIWIAGALLPDVEAGDRVKLALSELSGDWRNVNGRPLQMIASLAVNHGGFLASAGDASEEAAPAEDVEAGACGCNAAPEGETVEADQAAVAEAPEEPGPLDEDLAALVAAVAVDLDLSDEDLAAVDRDMTAVVTASSAPPVDETGEQVITAANWVQQTGTGHLPAYIRRIADHLKEQGMDVSRAIATAVNVVKRACSNPDGLNFPGVQKVTPQTRAQACRAVTEWEAKKAEARMK